MYPYTMCKFAYNLSLKDISIDPLGGISFSNMGLRPEQLNQISRTGALKSTWPEIFKGDCRTPRCPLVPPYGLCSNEETTGKGMKVSLGYLDSSGHICSPFPVMEKRDGWEEGAPETRCGQAQQASP